MTYLHPISNSAGVLPVSLDEARLRLRMDDTTSDAELEALLLAATRHCEQATRSSITPQRWQLFLRDFPADTIPLPQPPIISIDSITYCDTSGTWQNLPASSYSLTPHRFSPRIHLFNPPAVAPLPYAVMVNFTSGHLNTPPDLAMAILLLAGHFDAQREATTDRPLNEIPMGVAALIAPYTVPLVP